MSGLVLSLFPGIGLLDMAFEAEGFCVVRGPDLLWGGDIRRFHQKKMIAQGVPLPMGRAVAKAVKKALAGAPGEQER